jgi:hypothetical protein
MEELILISKAGPMLWPELNDGPMKHYLRTTGDHGRQASKRSAGSEPRSIRRNAISLSTDMHRKIILEHQGKFVAPSNNTLSHAARR